MVFCTCIFILLIATSWFGYNENAYSKGFGYKQELLIAESGPRLIIVGGSGSSFGIDSGILEKKTGRRVINTGMYAGYGMRFIYESIIPHIRETDVVIIIPEYELLHQPPWGDGYTLVETLFFNPSALSNLANHHTLVAMTRVFPTWWKEKISYGIKRAFGKLKTDDVYSFRNINLHGDLIDPRQEKTILSKEQLVLASIDFVRPQADPDSLRILKKFIEKVQESRAQVFVSWAPLPETTYVSNESNVNSREKELKSSINSSLILGVPKQFVYPDIYFYDAPTHLNAKGRSVRTREIADIVSKVLKNQ